MKLPSVSIVIPCYNSGAYIAEAVASAKQQEGRFVLDAITIVDDGSDDGQTLNILSAFKRESNVQVVANLRTKGPAGARNTGLAQVDSEWVAFLDADDVLTPNSIGARIDAAADYPEIAWCGGDFVFFSDGSPDTGQPVYRSGIKASEAFENYEFDKPLYLEKPVVAFIRQMLTWMGAVSIRTDVCRSMGGFREDLFQSEDNNLYIRLAREHDFLFVPEIMLAKRKHAEGLSKSRSAPREWTIRNFRSLLQDQDFKPYYGLLRQELMNFHFVNYGYFVKKKRYLSCFKELFCYAYYKVLWAGSRNAIKKIIMGKH